MRKTKLTHKISLLFPGINFLIGLGNIFSLPGNYYKARYSKSSLDTDKKALERDWEKIGQDMKNVISQYPVNKSKLF